MSIFVKSAQQVILNFQSMCITEDQVFFRMNSPPNHLDFFMENCGVYAANKTYKRVSNWSTCCGPIAVTNPACPKLRFKESISVPKWSEKSDLIISDELQKWFSIEYWTFELIRTRVKDPFFILLFYPVTKDTFLLFSCRKTLVPD